MDESLTFDVFSAILSFPGHFKRKRHWYLAPPISIFGIVINKDRLFLLKRLFVLTILFPSQTYAIVVVVNNFSQAPTVTTCLF